MLAVWTILYAFLIPPAAFDIDCRTYPGGIKAAVEYDVIALDGTRERFTLNHTVDATVEHVPNAVRVGFGPPHWQATKVSDTVVRVNGTKSPILFLTAKSPQWAPDVSRVGVRK